MIFNIAAFLLGVCVTSGAHCSVDKEGEESWFVNFMISSLSLIGAGLCIWFGFYG